MTSAFRGIIVSTLCVLALMQVSSCRRESGAPPWFELAADRYEITAPDTITFTGKLEGDISGLTTCYPNEFCFCPSVRRGAFGSDQCFCGDAGTAGNEVQMRPASPFPAVCICFSLCDSTQIAKRLYVKKQVYRLPGTFKASMTLNCRNGAFSDTVLVTVR